MDIDDLGKMSKEEMDEAFGPPKPKDPKENSAKYGRYDFTGGKVRILDTPEKMDPEYEAR